jgi:hypothetical protein
VDEIANRFSKEMCRMRSKRMKPVALVVLCGMVFGGCCGCLGLDSWWGRIIWDGALDQGWDWVLDNDAVYDLFEDGNV